MIKKGRVRVDAGVPPLHDADGTVNTGMYLGMVGKVAVNAYTN